MCSCVFNLHLLDFSLSCYGVILRLQERPPMKFSSSLFACLAFSAFVAFMSFLARFSEDLVELELEEALSSPFSAATRLCLLFLVGSGACLARLLLDLEVFDLPAPLADGTPQASLDFLPCSGADS